MPVFKIPTMNLICNVWRGDGAFPKTPDVTCNCNLSPGEFVVGNEGSIGMYLRVPAHTDLQWAISAHGSDIVEVPAGSGRFYIVAFVEDIAKGFPNEHRFAVLQVSANTPTPSGATPWPTPYP